MHYQSSDYDVTLISRSAREGCSAHLRTSCPPPLTTFPMLSLKRPNSVNRGNRIPPSKKTMI